MASLRSAALVMGAASVLLGSCGRSGAGGPAASGQPVSSAPPAASDTPASSAAASSLAPVAAEAPSPAPARPPPVPIAEKKREPTAAELLRDDPGYIARERRLEALYGNARDRDPTGQVERDHAQALAQRGACADKACLDRWFSRREAALKQYVEN